MAETPATTPPARAAADDDDTVKINDDGTVDTGGRRGWVWMSDPSTGHRFDVRSDSLPRPELDIVPGARVHYGPQGRPPKAFVSKDGGPRSATPSDAPVARRHTDDGAPAPEQAHEPADTGLETTTEPTSTAAKAEAKASDKPKAVRA